MPRYIDAEKLCELARNHINKSVDCNDIMRFPTADVQEVRHGRWEFRYDGAYGRCRFYCSSCGEHSGIGGIRKNQLKPYCPNCGAKMDEEEQE